VSPCSLLAAQEKNQLLPAEATPAGYYIEDMICQRRLYLQPHAANKLVDVIRALIRMRKAL
jgi:hypothetical protein